MASPNSPSPTHYFSAVTSVLVMLVVILVSMVLLRVAPAGLQLLMWDMFRAGWSLHGNSSGDAASSAGNDEIMHTRALLYARGGAQLRHERTSTYTHYILICIHSCSG